jgi:hypothetical protein
MLTFLLSLLLSKVATFAIPIALCAGAVYLLILRQQTIAIALAIGAAGYFGMGVIYNEGNDACESRYKQAAIEFSQKLDNEKTQLAQTQAALVAALKQGDDALNDVVLENTHAADKDPDAVRPCFNLGGVQRYEKLRTTGH